MTLEEQVQEAVDYFVRDVPPRHDLADVALRQARRQRRRRWLGLTGGTALVVATTFVVMMADPLGVLENTANEVAPADIAPPTDIELDDPEPDEPALPDIPVEVVVDLDALPMGPPPEVPWIADGDLHLADGILDVSDIEFTLDGRGGGASSNSGEFTSSQVEGGVVYLTGEPGMEEGPPEVLEYRTTDGRVVPLASAESIFGVAVSPSRALIAWSEGEPTATGWATTLLVFDVTTEEVVYRNELTDPEGGTGEVTSFLGNDQVVVDNAPFAGGGTFIWSLDANTVSAWLDGYGITEAIAPSNDVGVFNKGTRDDPSFDVLDLETEQALWSLRPYDWLRSFSPDGQFAALWVAQDPPAESYFVVVETRTGNELMRLDPVASREAWVNTASWEPDGDLVIMWTDYTTAQSAIVRCSVLGDCELATEPRDDWPAPHVLPSPF